MVKNIAFLLGIFLLVSCLSSKIDIGSGLLAYYPFDGNTQDDIGYNNRLNVEGSILTTDRHGNEKSAFSLDGNTSCLYTKNINLPAMDSAKTISWWFYAKAMPEYDVELGAENMLALVDSTSGIGIQFGFRAKEYKTKGFDVWQWGGGTFLDMDFPKFNTWHHCLYIYEGTTHTFYLDDKLLKTSTVKAKSGTPNILMLGNYPGGDQFFNGKIDEVRIYKRVLSSSEIKALGKL